MRYNGKTQDVALRYIVPEDRNVTVGKTVRLWKAVVVGQEADPKPCKHAAMHERVVQAKKPKGEAALFVDVHKEGK